VPMRGLSLLEFRSLPQRGYGVREMTCAKSLDTSIGSLTAHSWNLFGTSLGAPPPNAIIG
jgi:hypothetical protein